MVLILIFRIFKPLPKFEYGVIPNGAYTAKAKELLTAAFEYGVIPNGAYTMTGRVMTQTMFEYGVIPNGAYTPTRAV